MSEYILTLSCPDSVGIVSTVSTFLAVSDCNIKDSAQFGDAETGLFFMRVNFLAGANAPELKTLRASFETTAKRYGMSWSMVDVKTRSRLLILVSRQGHCLNDLLYRYRIGALHADIAGIVSNHETFSDLAAWCKIPFYHLPVTPETKTAQEKTLLEIVEKEEIDLVVLARYMQILSPEMCDALSGKCINIHHSFLPSFKGANPYRQAYSRGVKLIGATAHYVTGNLDEGPIITQEVERVDHSSGPEELAAIGRDVESVVLARAVRLHIERRVLLNGNKTVILR